MFYKEKWNANLMRGVCGRGDALERFFLDGHRMSASISPEASRVVFLEVRACCAVVYQPWIPIVGERTEYINEGGLILSHRGGLVIVIFG